MRALRFSRLTVLWKILLSTSLAITLIFAVTGAIVLKDATQTTSQSVEDEVKASFQAYKSLWNSRAQLLSSVSLILSTMSDVRAAFSTGDKATIRDTAGELWSKISEDNAIFLVTDAGGHVIASLGGQPESALPAELEMVTQAVPQFPKQVSGFLERAGHLYHITVTPVYVHATSGEALLDVLVAGYEVNTLVAQQLKNATGGSEFLFHSQDRVIASTLNSRATKQVLARLAASPNPHRVSDGVFEYAPLITPLQDAAGRPIGELSILRSFEAPARRIAALQRNIVLLWVFSMIAGLALTYAFAKRIVGPVKELDRAAAEVARQNYDYHVTVQSEDELGRLARTFNAMSASIRKARDELIRQERISTIGRLSTSIVHDLRNPLAAIYGGAEMLVDSDLKPDQVKRLAGNIYRASRRMQELLQELLSVSRGSTQASEMCNLRAVASAACELAAPGASVRISVEIPQELELPLVQNRIERVFLNLIGNAVEAMPAGGDIRISASAANGFALVRVEDSGPGIPPEIRERLFEPFVTAGKKGGLGLGLALARQTALDHGGDMWVESGTAKGACFVIRLPMRGVPG